MNNVLAGSSRLLATLELPVRAQQLSAATSDNLRIVRENGGTHEKDPTLFRGIIFSRQFILTYHAVVASLLLILTVRHWGVKIRRWQNRRSKAQSTVPEEIIKHIPEHYDRAVKPTHGGSSSSSSSTLQETIGPKSGKTELLPDEDSPLLGKPREISNCSDRKRGWDKIQGWLAYQPRPIPIINKALPSNGQSLAVVVLFALNAFYLFYNITFSIPLVFVFADRAALVFAANLPLLYLFAAKNQPIKILTGYSYESLNIFHRRLGEILCFSALLHGLGIVLVWYTLLRPTGMTFLHFLLIKVILLGMLALIAYETIYFTSLGSFRQRWYELFLGLHVFLQVAALVLLFFHHHGGRVYVGIALAIFNIDRLIYRLNLKTISSNATLTIHNDKETVGVHVLIPLTPPNRHTAISRLLPSTILNGWLPTHHVFLTIPSLSRLQMLQAHPFTIASQAPNLDSEYASLDLLVRARDGFSAKLLHHAQTHNTTEVRLDGPYGSQSAVELLRSSDISIIVAGGSGIAVAWPLLWSIFHHRKPPNEDYEANIGHVTPPHLGPAPQLKNFLFIWVMQHDTHKSWLGPHRPFLDLKDAVDLDLVITPPTSEGERPDLRHMIESWVEDQIALRISEGEKVGRSIGVVCSGPDGMNRAVRNTAAALRGRGVDIGVEIEKFGW
ncbi:MAG: hypothetical protein MMC33_000578 [Icmadophila ericetorum]|nr:hypothetical protein [Icmadophila ericetorum]